MTREPTVRRGGSGPVGPVAAIVVMGLFDLAVIGFLIALPLLAGNDLEVWRIVACAVLLTLGSGVFVAVFAARRRRDRSG